MLAPRLMTYGVLAMGILMVLVGLVFVSQGVPVVRMEIGWSEIIGGAVAASAGGVVLAIGLLMEHVNVLAARMAGKTAPAAVVAGTMIPQPPLRATLDDNTAAFEANPTEPVPFRPAHPLAPAVRRDAPTQSAAIVRPEPALTAALHPDLDSAPAAPSPRSVPEPVLMSNAPALVHEAEAEDEAEAEAIRSPVAATDGAADPVAEPGNPRVKSSFISSFLTRRMAATMPPRRQPPIMPEGPGTGTAVPPPVEIGSPARTSVDLSSGWDDERPAPTFVEAPKAATVREAPPIEPPEAVAPEDRTADSTEAEAPAPPQPVVVGRYNAGTASYVMYSNGMIEVETEQGTHQFASMQELKAFIERRDAPVA